MADWLSSPSRSKRFGLAFGKDKETKSKADSSGRKVKNLWGLVKSPSRKHKGSGKAGDDMKESSDDTGAMVSAVGNSPLKDSLKSDNHEEAKAPGMLKEIKNEVKDMAHKAKDFANKVHEKTDSLLHRHSEHPQDEQKEESTPTNKLPESKEKGHGLVASAKEELQSLLHKERTEEAKKLDGESKPEKHDEETQGNEKKLIDENTPVHEIKAPGVIERAKEEVEAVVQTIHDHHQKKQITSDVDHNDDQKHKSAEDHEKANELEAHAAKKTNEDGCECTLAKGLQKICAPWSTKDQD